jgi:hypothetical protein
MDRSGNPFEKQSPDTSDRQAQPVNLEEPPRLPFPVVGIGAFERFVVSRRAED